MWPSGWSGRRPYFTIEEANEIFGAIPLINSLPRDAIIPPTAAPCALSLLLANQLIPLNSFVQLIEYEFF